MAADPLFGWDLTFKTVERDVRRKSDVIVAFIHWNLSKRGFRSIGIGDEVGTHKSLIMQFYKAWIDCYYYLFTLPFLLMLTLLTPA